jgi:hypothetical protein
MPPHARHPRHRLFDTVRKTAASTGELVRRQFGIQDQNGNLRVGIGDLGAYVPALAGDYGVVIGGPGLTPIEMWPIQAETYFSTAVGPFGTGWESLATYVPVITAYIGASGRALVGISVTGVSGASSTVFGAGISVNSGSPPTTIATATTISASGFSNYTGTATGFMVVTATAQTNATFELFYTCANNVAVSPATLTVTPL